MPTTPTPTPTAAAWHWVLRHSRLIDWAASKLCPASADVDDMRQDLVEHLVSVHHRYDPSRSAPSNWIRTQAWGLRTKQLRRFKRDEKIAAAGLLLAEAPRSWPPSIEQQAEVARIVERSEPHHQEAMRTVLDGLTKSEVRASIGVSYQARDGRLRRLANRFPDYEAA